MGWKNVLPPHILNRDFNAACNIRDMGLKQIGLGKPELTLGEIRNCFGRRTKKSWDMSNGYINRL